jgi:hypothetical protein
MIVKALNKVPAVRPPHALFCRIRNEDYFIPHFLAHYRKLGIDHFYFADDQSNDGTREFLLEQSDCTVFGGDTRFSEQIGDVQAKVVVAREVPEQVIGAGWTLTVDCDEFMVLPKPFQTIGQLTSHLDGLGKLNCTAAMVDFYPRTLAGRFADRHVSPFESFPFFDIGPYFIWREGELVPFLLYAGVRHRLNEWMVERDRGKIWQVYRPTILQKVPLVKWGHGLLPEKNSHMTNIPPFTGVQVALAHFKFYPDLDRKIEEAIASGHYQGNSYYYRLLKRYLPVFENRLLIALVSRRYKTPADLVSAHLMFADGPPF